MLDGLSIIISIVINGAVPSAIPNGAIVEEGTNNVYMITEDTNEPIVQE